MKMLLAIVALPVLSLFAGCGHGHYSGGVSYNEGYYSRPYYINRTGHDWDDYRRAQWGREQAVREHERRRWANERW